MNGKPVWRRLFPCACSFTFEVTERITVRSSAISVRRGKSFVIITPPYPRGLAVHAASGTIAARDLRMAGRKAFWASAQLFELKLKPRCAHTRSRTDCFAIHSRTRMKTQHRETSLSGQVRSVSAHVSRRPLLTPSRMRHHPRGRGGGCARVVGARGAGAVVRGSVREEFHDDRRTRGERRAVWRVEP